MKAPLVSVIIPTYSRPTNLIRAIESVLKQDYPNKEIIVVDDNGLNTDFQVETQKILTPYIENGLIKYIPHDVNKNGSAARNTGFKASHGDFINFFDDDDEMSEGYLSKHVENLKNHPEYDAAFCDNIIQKRRGWKHFINKISHETNIMQEMLIGNLFFNTSTVMFRRQVLIDINGWDESFFRHQDLELYIRFFRNHQMGKTETASVKKYLSSSIVTGNAQKAYEFKLKFMNAFKDEIYSWPKSKEVYRHQWNLIITQMILIGNYKYVGRALKQISSNSSITINCYLIYIKYFFMFIIKCFLNMTAPGILNRKCD